jgi:hypothetical protein
MGALLYWWSVELVDRLLARLPVDHPSRTRVEDAGRELDAAILEYAKGAVTAAHQERKLAARRLRIFVSTLQSATAAHDLAAAYAELRLSYRLVPWRAVNDALEGLFGGEGEQLVKKAAAKIIADRPAPSPPAASWRRRR